MSVGPSSSSVSGSKRRRGDLAAEVSHSLRQMPYRHGLDAGEGDLGRRLGGADDVRETRPAGAFGDRERPCDRPDAAVERELTDGCVVGEALRGQLPRRREYREGDGEVEPGALLAQGRGCKVHRDPAVERPLERRGDDPAPNPVLRLLAGPVGEPDDRESGNARLEMSLHLDLAWLEADQRMRDRACEHASKVGAKASRVSEAFAPKELLQGYGV